MTTKKFNYLAIGVLCALAIAGAIIARWMKYDDPAASFAAAAWFAATLVIGAVLLMAKLGILPKSIRVRFSIRDMLLVTAIIALGLSWWLDNRANDKRAIERYNSGYQLGFKMGWRSRAIREGIEPGPAPERVPQPTVHLTP